MAERIPLLAFTVAGPMGHFRKFYSNTSALTYPFPPRTTLMGLIAGLLGKPRDSYYTSLDSERLWITLRILSPVRVRTFTVNYLHTKQAGQFYDRKGAGTQIPMGWVLPHPPARCLRYRVYVSTPDPKLWNELERVFTQRTFHWPPYLGISEALAWIEPKVWIGEVAYESFREEILLATPAVQHHEIRLSLKHGQRILLDRFVLDLTEKPYRSPRKIVDMIYEEKGRPLQIHVPYPVFRLPKDDEVKEEEKVFGAFWRDPEMFHDST